MTRLLIDGDGCPVKDECYRVADRLGLQVIVVANHWLRVPQAPRYSLIVVESGLDVADDRLVEEAKAGDVVVTADIPLASRVVGRGALAVTPKGRLLDAGTVGAVLAVVVARLSLPSSAHAARRARPAAAASATRRREWEVGVLTRVMLGAWHVVSK